MKFVLWLLVIAAAAALVYWFRSWRRRWTERKEASEERFAGLMAQAVASAKSNVEAAQPAGADALAKQRLLMEAAAKAGEADEAVLSIQLYARLLSRYPDTSFAAQARAAVETQKKKLAKS